MKMIKRTLTLLLCAVMALALGTGALAASDAPVDTVLFYVKTGGGDMLVSHIGIDEMVSDMESGLISGENHNYSILDRYVTPVHQEGRGLTVAQFVSYAAQKSTVPELRAAGLGISGNDRISFWERDQRGFDDMDSYTYDELCSEPGYNYPELYRYWDYRLQKLDGDGLEKVLASREEQPVLLAVESFSQRYIAAREKFDAGDFDLENAWQQAGLLDTQRSLRLLLPMTEQQLRTGDTRLSDGRFWIANVLLEPEAKLSIMPQGTVAAPTAVLTEDADNWYVRFSCDTPGASILYNQTYSKPDYTPTRLYDGAAVKIAKSEFPDGNVTISCRAVRDGWTDAGVVTLRLTSSGAERSAEFSDVPADAWYSSYVNELAAAGVINGMTADRFEPDGTVTYGQALKLVMLAAGYAEQPATGAHWASGYLDAARRDGLTAYSGSLDAPISRLELCRIAAAALKLDEPAQSSPFTDTDDPSVLALCEKGVINGMGDGIFAPGAQLTRAQISKIIWSIRTL